mmetsp:Transcript_29693/g.27154  ORF Transcript_29693/g.27154 Transcript_29693/m.27154 type:complete len:194 (+) Transcript_29693:1654-2235(+)
MTFGKEARMLALVNSKVPEGCMKVSFKGLFGAKNDKYYIKYRVETLNGTKTYNTNQCDPTTLEFNYEEDIEMFKKGSTDASFTEKQIQVHVMLKSGCLCFGSLNDVCNGVIPLKKFQNTNSIRGKLKMDDVELQYEIQTRQLLFKHQARLEIPSVTGFAHFPPFDKDAPIAVNQADVNVNVPKTPPKNQNRGN